MKQLDYGAKAKLTAHYEHLYPEQVIVDEKDILEDLPPRMREELVRSIYGTVITSVPIFVGQDTMVLTELCTSLTALPALKGELIVREGQIGYEMHCISSGACRVTQHLRGSDDVARVKAWIEETFQQKGVPVQLFDANQRAHLEHLLRKMRSMARRKMQAYRALTLRQEELQAEVMAIDAEPTDEVAANDLDLKEDQLADVTVQLEKLYCQNLTYDDLMDNGEVMDTITKSGAKLPDLLKAAHKQGRLVFEGTIPPPVGAKLQFSLKSGGNLEGDSPMQMMCAALRDGVYLLDLLNVFLPPKQQMIVWRPGINSEVSGVLMDITSIVGDGAAAVKGASTHAADEAAKMSVEAATKAGGAAAASAIASAQAASAAISSQATAGIKVHVHVDPSILAQDAMDARTCRPNLKAFCLALSDAELPFKLAAESICRPDDLLQADRGTMHDQQHRQKRILKTLLTLAMEVSNAMPGYLGPKLDEQNLGTLGPGDFFGELSLLPLRQRWRHRRTTTAVQNSMMYFMGRSKIEMLCKKFPDLAHALVEHAEDYEKMQSQGIPKSTGKDGFKKYGEKLNNERSEDHDPIVDVQEQLAQTDVKLEQLSGVQCLLH